MAEITAALVKALREATGAGMMDCKKALTETGGDLEAGKDWLRAKGLSAAAKKAGRVAAEGLVALAAGDRAGALVEVNSETDFVARNDQFRQFVRTVAGLVAAAGGDVEKLKQVAYPGTGRTVAEELTQLVATIGENMSLRRASTLSVPQGFVAGYMHGAAAEGLGRIGVLVALESAGDAEKLAALGKQLAMHVAAAAPQAVSADALDPAVVERERQVLIEQAKESGKTQAIAEKMVEGRLRKFYQDVVLLEQTWIMDNESRVSAVLKAAEKDVGAPIKVTGFQRFSLGEGIQREEQNLAAEVAATLSR